MLLTCFHLLLFQSIHYIKAQTLNNTNKSICITDTDEDINTISSVYNPIIYDPRFDPNENPPQLTCNNRTIWISQDSKYIIYYKIFTDTSISYKPPNTDIVDIPAFGIFECSKDSYLDVLQSQSLNIPSNNLCIDPATIYPDSYPGSQCISKPIVYCLPFIDETKCPQFQATMASMYNAVDLSKDLVNMHNFYDCNCWFKPNNGDTNNDERVDIDISFDKNCRQILEKMKAENDENIWQNQPHEKKDENPETEDMNINKNGFDILWIILSTLIGLIMFIIIALFLHRKQWHRKMYLSSRKYLRNWHRGDVENENLMQIDNGM
eukprot:469978_1